MKLELTESQYRTLVKVVYLGTWMVNATKTGEDIDQTFEDIEQLVFALSKEIDMSDWIEYDDKFGGYFPTRILEDEVYQYIKAYDDDVFWEELIGRLARRDLFREIGPVSQLSDENFSRQFELEETYEKEFVNHGLKNLELIKK